jgi:hypothetical protein
MSVSTHTAPVRTRTRSRVESTGPIVCSICGSGEWWRCLPGQSALASHVTPDQRQTILLFPGDDVPSVAWCMGCDPLLARS